MTRAVKFSEPVTRSENSSSKPEPGFEWDRTQRFSGTTDENGLVVINNLPPNSTESIAVEHGEFDMPISGRDRSVQVDLKPDTVNEVALTMQKKGSDTLGEQVDEDADDGQGDEAEKDDKTEKEEDK